MGNSLCCTQRGDATQRMRPIAMMKSLYNLQRPEIEHVVVLMLESRSFDSVLGVLFDKRYADKIVAPSKWDVEGLTGKTLYDYNGKIVTRDGATEEMPVWSRFEDESILGHEGMSVPAGSPLHRYLLHNRCLFGCDEPETDSVATMSGFAQEYYNLEMYDADVGNLWDDRTDFTKKRSPAMHVYLPQQMEVFTELASQFGCSDTYFASAPCPSWPNRLFAHASHCYGYVDNLVDNGDVYDREREMPAGTADRMSQFSDPTIFSILQKFDLEWSIYHGDWALSSLLNLELHGNAGFVRSYDYKANFANHVRSNLVPPFVWIEPKYLADGDKPPTDMHPPHNTVHAQELVAEVYNTLRANESVWKRTVLFVTFSDSAGSFDHVPPPEAPDPEKGYDKPILGFIGQEDPTTMKSNPFTRYGARVPCLIATPFLDRAAVVRPDERFSKFPFDHTSITRTVPCLIATPFLDPATVVRPDDRFSKFPFDHTSITRTVLDLFVGADVSMTERDKAAPSFVHSFSKEPRADLGPQRIDIKAKAAKHSFKRLQVSLQPPRQSHNVRLLMDHAMLTDDLPMHQSLIRDMRDKMNKPCRSHMSTAKAGLEATNEPTGPADEPAGVGAEEDAKLEEDAGQGVDENSNPKGDVPAEDADKSADKIKDADAKTGDGKSDVSPKAADPQPSSSPETETPPPPG
eukprot:TRINITY_DN11581_c0_g1_i6.p1 TRINITY_DN11581_c0_g1~~TRINITY_DN11581_c0_g1_i6.p1  ORF type:complete len:688 (+),score=114.07 TRINITY_DN11581_c0_g1_i6:118-2181(+)